MKKEKKNEAAQEQDLRRREAQQNQDEARLRTLQKYGLEYRGRTHGKTTEHTENDNEQEKTTQNRGKSKQGKEDETQGTTARPKQHIKPLILKKMRQVQKENTRKIRENTTNRTEKTNKQLYKVKRSETPTSKNTMRKTTKSKN